MQTSKIEDVYKPGYPIRNCADFHADFDNGGEPKRAIRDSVWHEVGIHDVGDSNFEAQARGEQGPNPQAVEGCGV